MLYVYWFRKDLRIEDNHGLYEFLRAASGTNKFSFLYIKNKNTFNYFGEKRIRFLSECLEDLKKNLNSMGFELQILYGKSADVFSKIIEVHGNVSVYCNEQAEPYCIKRDGIIKALVRKNKGQFHVFTDTTIFKNDEVKNISGAQYKVFTPFRNQALRLLEKNHYRKYEADFTLIEKSNEVVLQKAEQSPDYSTFQKSETLRGGRNEGLKLLKNFYAEGLENYNSVRNVPAINGTSLLSAHIHFGTVGIRECFRTAFVKLKKSDNESKKTEVRAWVNELLWREFYYSITFNNPRIIHESYKREYDKLRWNYDEKLFGKWCEGQTGFPIVDAGMRQLNTEGWMHNRLRMITAMFLTKDLFIDWRHGEKYFAEKLIDLDFSNNNGGWQWSASTGVDSQPYFRIFNPVLQSRRFDAEGKFIRKYLPELRSVPVKFIHEPQLMSKDEQIKSKVIIGKDYPEQIVSHNKSKEMALERFKEINPLK